MNRFFALLLSISGCAAQPSDIYYCGELHGDNCNLHKSGCVIVETVPYWEDCMVLSHRMEEFYGTFFYCE